MADNSFYDDFCGCEACMRREKRYFAELEKEREEKNNASDPDR